MSSPLLDAAQASEAHDLQQPQSQNFVGAAPALSVRARLKRTLQTVFGFSYDFARFARYSTAMRPERDAASLAAHIAMDSHRIEKGLALPQPRPGFGPETVERLISNVRYFEARFGGTATTRSARAALSEYREAADAIGRPCAGALDFLEPGDGAPELAGTCLVTREQIHQHSKRDLTGFFSTRYSIRQFTGEAVTLDIIEQAVLMAMKTPSVCNRQSARAHALLTPETIEKALTIQGGNRGFGHLAGALIVITVDVRNFVSSAERYQGWIDGGLFAMSLCYALHSLGLGTCMLNWSVNPRVDLRLRQTIPVPEHENVIVMMAVGHLPTSLRVARSPRHDLAQVLRVH